MRYLQLTNSDERAIIDDEDFERVSEYNWQKSGNGYVYRSEYVGNYRGRTIWLHRVVLRVRKGRDVDHKNRNRLDNRRENLRSCSRSQNMASALVQRNNSSGFRGVIRDKKRKNWYAQIWFQRKRFFLGYFDSPVAAARFYNQKAKELFGEFAYQNRV